MARSHSRGHDQPGEESGRIRARPGPPTVTGPAGERPIGLVDGRDGLLFVPASLRPDRPAPLAVLLHGAGGNARRGLSSLRDRAEAAGLILLAPDSRGPTWDLLLATFGPDVGYLDRALAQTFDQYAIDPTRLAIGGFSDGASYALSLGLTNGDLFTHVIAFSPGFLLPAAQRGRPRLYIAHGTRDDVLPIGACSRRIVPSVRDAGYEILYREFDGPHTVPPDIAREALEWFLHDRE